MYKDYDLASLEREYSPSSCVHDINIYIEQYIKQSQKHKANARLSNTLIENISYGDSHHETIDLFLPEPSERAQKKLQVYIHGGYWQELSKEESCFAANTFQQHGFHFAVINYDLAPNVSLKEIVEQNRRALVWLFHHAEKFGYQSDEIYLSGSSAGAHLVALMALTNWEKEWGISTQFIKGICVVSGIYDLTPIQFTYINKPLQLTQQEIKTLSPLLTPDHLSRLVKCKLIVAHGDNETHEFKCQSYEFYQKAKTVSPRSEFAQIDNRNHFDVILDLADDESRLFQLIHKQMQ